MLVVSFSRRTDGVANEAQLDKFLAALAQHRRTAVISWSSRDYTNLIHRWTNDAQAAKVLNAYRHHFSFTINGESRSVLEPGLQSSQDIAVSAWCRAHASATRTSTPYAKLLSFLKTRVHRGAHVFLFTTWATRPCRVKSGAGTA